MAEQPSKITKLLLWLSDHPKTLKYLADNPGILKWLAKYGDNIDAIIKVISKDSEGPLKMSEIKGIKLDLPNFLKSFGLGAGVGYLLGRGSKRDDD